MWKILHNLVVNIILCVAGCVKVLPFVVQFSLWFCSIQNLVLILWFALFSFLRRRKVSFESYNQQYRIIIYNKNDKYIPKS